MFIVESSETILPKLLIVDDQPLIVTVLNKLLSEDFEVLTANSGSEAIDACNKFLPDLILLDVTMPGMSGHEVCAQLKKNPRTKDIPVIFVTGHSDPDEEAIGLQLGAVDYITKPINPVIARARVRTQLMLRKAAKTLENQTAELERLVTLRTEALESTQNALRESMHNLRTTKVCAGVYWVQVPEADLYILCGAPADVVKHLMLKGYIAQETRGGMTFETGPNVILLSDKMMQGGAFSNLSEFPVLQMLYRQGLILPGHPNNVGRKPIIVGSEHQVKAQLDYIYRGNYGLTSEEELRAAGLDETEAKRQMALKLSFAFGQIRTSDALIDTRVVHQEPIEIANDVWVRRIAPNRYEFIYRNDVTEVNLDLGTDETYESPYSPSHQLIERQFFGVIHSGEGDGWDVRRQSMSSILMFQGRFYLIDAGPTTIDTLLRLGIDISEISGIFHTHAHDDHFAGLPSLILSGHKIKYYATPLVRHSVTKKLAALMSIDESLFGQFFEICDLVEGRWNNCGGMDVLPFYSPHPVENNVFVFRAMDDNGFKTYAHWADIVSFDVLKKLLANPSAQASLPSDYFETVRERYLTPVTVKKIDSGGGLIHGQPLDFSEDASEKIILAHRAGPFSRGELGIGSQASFGSVDVLISSSQDYLRRRAFRFLSELLPQASPEMLDTLMRAAIETFNAGSIILKPGSRTERVFLVLTGTVEYTSPKSIHPVSLTTGSVIGAHALLQDVPMTETWRATSAVRMMCLSVKTMRAFLNETGLMDRVRDYMDLVDFLQRTWLLGTQISSIKHVKLAIGGSSISLKENEKFSPITSPCLYMVRKGRLDLLDASGQAFETLTEGDCFGEEFVLGKPSQSRGVRSTCDAELIGFANFDIFKNTPILLWKLMEIFGRRNSNVNFLA